MKEKESESPLPHGFCATPESKCTMNYCDENGCNDRKRELTEPSESPLIGESQAAQSLAYDLVAQMAYSGFLDPRCPADEATRKVKDALLQFSGEQNSKSAEALRVARFELERLSQRKTFKSQWPEITQALIMIEDILNPR